MWHSILFCKLHDASPSAVATCLDRNKKKSLLFFGFHVARFVGCQEDTVLVSWLHQERSKCEVIWYPDWPGSYKAKFLTTNGVIFHYFFSGMVFFYGVGFEFTGPYSMQNEMEQDNDIHFHSIFIYYIFGGRQLWLLCHVVEQQFILDCFVETEL